MDPRIRLERRATDHRAELGRLYDLRAAYERALGPATAPLAA